MHRRFVGLRGRRKIAKSVPIKSPIYVLVANFLSPENASQSKSAAQPSCIAPVNKIAALLPRMIVPTDFGEIIQNGRFNLFYFRPCAVVH